MTVVRCALKGRDYVSCNRAYGCPCQFNSLPTYGKCHEVVPIVDAKASPELRDALLRTMSDTEPGAPLFQVFSATFATIHDPVFSEIDFDVDARTARLYVPGWIEASGEPLRNPVTGREHRARIHLPDGFEYDFCEVGSGTARTQGPVALVIEASHAQFARF